MSVFRGYAGRRGVSVPARQSAKLKTLLQDLAIGMVFLPVMAEHYPGRHHLGDLDVAVVTIYTGIEYLRDARRLLGSDVVAATDGLGGRHAA